MLIAVVHVLGSIGVSVALTFLLAMLRVWEEDRVKRRRFQDAALALNLSVKALDQDPAHLPALTKYMSQRYSGELFVNRISDLCGAIRTAWMWFGSAVQALLLGIAAWQMYSEGREYAVMMWLIVVTGVLFWLVSVVFSYACLLLTGRYPGEAKGARTGLAAFLERQHEGRAA